MDRIPSVEKYVWALPQKATDCSRKMLRKHYWSPRYHNGPGIESKDGLEGQGSQRTIRNLRRQLRRLLTRENVKFQIEVLCSFDEEETEHSSG